MSLNKLLKEVTNNNYYAKSFLSDIRNPIDYQRSKRTMHAMF